MAQYHLSPESKFLNGQFCDRGRTERRHVVVTSMTLIAKEANRVGESGLGDPTIEAVKVFRRLAQASRYVAIGCEEWPTPAGSGSLSQTPDGTIVRGARL